MPEIRSDYSAQRIDAQPNPMLVKCLNRVMGLAPNCKCVLDLGCGKLRHLSLLRSHYHHITLVDTTLQLGKEHKLGGKTCTIPRFMDTLRKRKGETLTVMDFTHFSTIKPLRTQAIFCTAVFDVVVPSIRRAIVFAVHKHLCSDGLFILVVPRNDSSIIRRCKPDNAFNDGYIFAHHGIHTFYHNFADSSALAKSLCRQGFKLLEDISVYRQIGLILRKQ